MTGYVSGTWTVTTPATQTTQAIIGVTSQSFSSGGGGAQGTTSLSSAYIPFYYSDSQQIHRSDDLKGTNQVSFGSQGSGPGQFYGANGIALNAAGRIYVADTYNCRIVRMDDMNGTNGTSYGDGNCGSAPGQFSSPMGLAVDSNGRIYVIDSGNSQLVRMDNMTGANWTTFGTPGTGVNQFSQFTAVALDAAGNIYVPDIGRLVSMADMNGTNWTVLTQSPSINGVNYAFQSPVAVAIDPAGKIYVADNQTPQPVIIRVDDMAGDNWTIVSTGNGSGLNSISVDASGSVFTGGGGVRLIDNMTGVLTSSGTIAPLGPYYVFGVTSIPLPSPRPSAITVTPAALTFSQNVGTTSATQPVKVANFGGSNLNFNFSNIGASGPFLDTISCPNALVPGTSCTVNVSFSPSTTGSINGLLTISDDSGNLGPAQSVALTGLGTAPVASVAPAGLTFSSVMYFTSASKNVTLQNTGNGPLQVTSISATQSFSETDNCLNSTLAPGGACTVQVAFTPTALGSASGTLTISDNAGTQTVSLGGTGIAPVTISPNSLSFGTVAAGNTSAAQNVTLKNKTGSLSFSSITASAGFSVASTTCGAGIAG